MVIYLIDLYTKILKYIGEKMNWQIYMGKIPNTIRILLIGMYKF